MQSGPDIAPDSMHSPDRASPGLFSTRFTGHSRRLVHFDGDAAMIKLSRIGRFGLMCVAASVLSSMQGAYAQSQSFFWEPEDPPYEGYPQIGTGVAVSGRTAAVGAPYYDFYANPDAPSPLWEGLVNVYTTDAERTRWTLLTVLHADDA